MQLVFQERCDGYRVVKVGPHGEELEMIAAVHTKRAVYLGDPLHKTLWTKWMEEKVKQDGMPTAEELKGLEGATMYHQLPRAECSVHSAKGALTVEELDGILAKLPA